MCGRKEVAFHKRGLRVRRWLVLSLGLGIAAAAGYVLLTSSPPPSGSHDEIGDPSRARLQEILRKAESEETPAG